MIPDVETMEASPPDSTETPDLVVNVSHFKTVIRNILVVNVSPLKNA